MKTKYTTHSEQELREAVYRWFHDNDIRIHVDRIEPLFELIQSERKKIIGNDEKCKHIAHIEPCNDIVTIARNHLRSEQRQKLAKLAQKEKSK